MKHIFSALIIIYSVALSQTERQVSWTNIDTTYQSLDQVAPYLVNNTQNSIYFFKAWPFYMADILKFNESSKIWEVGASMGYCGTVAKPDEPLELLSTKRIDVALYPRACRNTVKGKPMFLLEYVDKLPDSARLRPMKGRYKLRMNYSLEPWTISQYPNKIFTAESPEFNLK